MSAWPGIANAGDVASPALLLDEARMEANLAATLRMAGDPKRLRPHLKTHKLPQLVRRQVAVGITRAKVATIAEAEMAATHGIADVLLALQPVGPAAARLARLAASRPDVQFSAVLDDPGAARGLAAAASVAGVRLGAFIDLDVGQHRTGIAPGLAGPLVREVAGMDSLVFRGLHAYDGHVGLADLAARRAACDAGFAEVEALIRRLAAEGIGVPVTVAGGSPTFAIHAARTGVELSPGTTILWDAGYARKLPDLPFEPAAFLLTRVVSRPTADTLCLDLGHKAVASEMNPPRALFPELPDAEAVSHSEEHLVLRTARAASMRVGDILYAIPWHVCPTVALHQEAWLVRDGLAVECWPIEARARRLTV